MKCIISDILLYILIFNCITTLLQILSTECCKISLTLNKKNDSKDPFKSIGIPELNPKQLLEELDKEKEKNNSNGNLNSIDDLPNFLKYSKLSDEKAMEVLTRFLLQDDITLKPMGAIYDHSGRDGLKKEELSDLPDDIEMKTIFRARSSASIFMKKNLNKPGFNSVGAEPILDEIVPKWKVMKVMMADENNENYYIKVCLPIDESLVAMCSDKDEPCADKAKTAEEAKQSNEDYLSKIKEHYFTNRSNINNKKMYQKRTANLNKVINNMNMMNLNMPQMQNNQRIQSIQSIPMQNYPQNMQNPTSLNNNQMISPNQNVLNSNAQINYAFKQLFGGSNNSYLEDSIPNNSNNPNMNNINNNNNMNLTGQGKNQENLLREIANLKGQVNNLSEMLKQKTNMNILNIPQNYPNIPQNMPNINNNLDYNVLKQGQQTEASYTINGLIPPNGPIGNITANSMFKAQTGDNDVDPTIEDEGIPIMINRPIKHMNPNQQNNRNQNINNMANMTNNRMNIASSPQQNRMNAINQIQQGKGQVQQFLGPQANQNGY